MNYAQSRIPALFYSRHVVRGDNGAMPPPIPTFSG